MSLDTTRMTIISTERRNSTRFIYPQYKVFFDLQKKNEKLDTQKIAVNVLKLEQHGFTIDKSNEVELFGYN